MSGILWRLLLWTSHAHQVLSQNIHQQCGFPGAGHAEGVGLHDPDFIRPEARLAMNVVPDDDGVLFESFLEKPFVILVHDSQRRMRPTRLFVLLVGHRIAQEVPNHDEQSYEVERDFDQLYHAEMETGIRNVEDRSEEHRAENRQENFRFGIGIIIRGARSPAPRSCLCCGCHDTCPTAARNRGTPPRIALRQ